MKINLIRKFTKFEQVVTLESLKLIAEGNSEATCDGETKERGSVK